ncbi:MAG TPA: Gfo/Idh/MocA family oxidoreductase [Pirellulales bacterium]|nr:Gfo/Idh/MocA family oxidoreductase [Pirellulales bacterium]
MEDRLSFAWSAAQRTVSSGRIGTPVALRLMDYGQPDHGRLPALLAWHADRACTLLEAEPALVWAGGRPANGQIDLQIRSSQGQSLLLSAGALAHEAPPVELMVIGQRGIACWEPDDLPSARAATAAAELSARGRDLLQAISHSLETGVASPPGAARAAASRPQTLEIAAIAEQPMRQAHASGVRPLGVLLLSGGQTHQEMYAPAFAADPRCRLIGLTDENDVSPRRRALNEQLAQSLGIPLLASLDDALARTDVHVVSICAEPERRARVIQRVLAAGKHLYLDKPLATTIDEARRIRAQARASGVCSQMFSLVHSPPAERVRAVLESGRLGELLAVHCDLFFAKGPAGTARFGEPRRETAHPTTFEAVESKRELYNIGVYPLAMLAWLLKKKVRRVFATTGNYFFAEHQRNDMEDFAQASFEFDGGVTATVCVGRTGWRSHPAGGVQRTWLIGTRGTACIDAYRPRLEIWSDEPAWPTPARSPEDPMGFWTSTQSAVGIVAKQAWLAPSDEHADVRHFVDCLVAGRDSDLPAEYAAEALEALLAAYQSAATGQPVSIARP